MSANPNKLSQFWQEIKRRNVHRSLAVYAGSAFVILEASTIIFPRWGLPDWSIDLVLYLLILGAFITIIVSWIFDVTGEGIERTRPISEIREGEKPVVSAGWKIATYVSFVVIVGLVILNIISSSGKKEILDKSIAVLPFRNDSPDQERMYFINGTMEAILDNLCKIKDMRVVSRNSVEQYRNNPKPTPVVAEEMNVSYILEGSGHRDGNNVKLFVQLLDGQKDQHLWSKSYDADIEEIFTLQSEIAQLVAGEIEAIITPEEKELIEKVPTTNLTAYDFYQKGEEEHRKYFSGDSLALERAEDLFHYALEEDSTFAPAYVGLAKVYSRKNYWPTYLSENFLDSALNLLNIALSFDDQLPEAYWIKGWYYKEHNKKELAINEFDKAIKLNPNEWRAYQYKAFLYTDVDLVNAIDNFQKSASLHKGPYLPEIYRQISVQYNHAGFKEKAINYAEEALKLNDDSAQYYSSLGGIESTNGNFEKAIEFYEKSYAIDSTDDWVVGSLGRNHLWLGQYEQYLDYAMKDQERSKTLDTSDLRDWGGIGFVYWVNGDKEAAEYCFNKTLEYYNELNKLDRFDYKDFTHYYNLAGLHAILGNKDKAYEYLKLMNQRETMPLWISTVINYDPMFDSIRNEPEFQQIVRDVEAKYLVQHERVRQWLEENDML